MMTSRIKIFATADIHGNYFPRTLSPAEVSLARVDAYLHAEILKHGDDSSPRPHLILDAGDFLSGGPAAYFCNYVEPDYFSQPAFIANWIGYDAITAGNHDLELPPDVLERFVKDSGIPLLGANMPECSPYRIFNRGDINILVVGLCMPPFSRRLDDPVEFLRSAIANARRTAEIHLVIGLFHLGPDECVRIAEQVDELQIIFCGHDHKDVGVKIARRMVPVINPGPGGKNVAKVAVEFTGRQLTSIHAELVDMNTAPAPIQTPLLPGQIDEWQHEEFGVYGPTMRLSHLVRLCMLRAIPEADYAVCDDTDRLLDGPQTIRDTFDYLPYDDYVAAVRDGEGRIVAVTPHIAAEKFPDSPILRLSRYPLRHYVIGEA